MAFYLYRANYSPEAIKAMVGNPQDREAPARKAIEAVGGKLHHIFLALGDSDIVALIEAPDDTVVAAVSLVVGASGAITGGSTTKLLTMEEAMAAMTKAHEVASAYTPPSG